MPLAGDEQMVTETCETIIDLPVGDKILIGWPVTGATSADSAEVSLDDGPFQSLVIGDGEALGYFAGPSNGSPSGAIEVATTSHVEIRITTATQRVTRDGGFIRLVP
jgi:hypothetical protein